jgi:hypothetical protein
MDYDWLQFNYLLIGFVPRQMVGLLDHRSYQFGKIHTNFATVNIILSKTKTILPWSIPHKTLPLWGENRTFVIS